MTTPADLYQQKVASSLIEYNPAQNKVIRALDTLYYQIVSPNLLTKSMSFLGLLRPIKGIYLWGGVGRGKTFLVDIFYECLPHGVALRIHFHRFMHRVHELLTKFQGHVDPLEDVAKDFIHYKVLVFDEFYVSDITDAMLLGTLFQKLFKKGMILVATSNIQPDMLYLNGLQRPKFLPAIDAIKKYCNVICINSDIDFRTRALSTIQVFYSPINDHTDDLLSVAFHKLSPNSRYVKNHVIKINDRQIITKMHADNIIWFKFSELCEGPRSVEDYIQLAKLYDTIIISEVPVFDEHNQDSARRFIELIDELYDRKVKLVMSCATDIQHLFKDGANGVAFERTVSRLIEMQTSDYIGLERIK